MPYLTSVDVGAEELAYFNGWLLVDFKSDGSGFSTSIDFEAFGD